MLFHSMTRVMQIVNYIYYQTQAQYITLLKFLDDLQTLVTNIGTKKKIIDDYKSFKLGWKLHNRRCDRMLSYGRLNLIQQNSNRTIRK